MNNPTTPAPRPSDLKGINIKLGPFQFQAESLPIQAFWVIIILVAVLGLAFVYALTHLDTATFYALLNRMNLLASTVKRWWKVSK